MIEESHGAINLGDGRSPRIEVELSTVNVDEHENGDGDDEEEVGGEWQNEQRPSFGSTFASRFAVALALGF
jgi:hypothetical protein